jgi:hypothetical protein
MPAARVTLCGAAQTACPVKAQQTRKSSKLISAIIAELKSINQVGGDLVLMLSAPLPLAIDRLTIGPSAHLAWPAHNPTHNHRRARS